uniref:Uncharacterized protein n=1 Tax=Solanum tuberosum TaxID=4113 RepID=M1BWF2_SOLTU
MGSWKTMLNQTYSLYIKTTSKIESHSKQLPIKGGLWPALNLKPFLSVHMIATTIATTLHRIAPLPDSDIAHILVHRSSSFQSPTEDAIRKNLDAKLLKPFNCGQSPPSSLPEGEFSC